MEESCSISPFLDVMVAGWPSKSQLVQPFQSLYGVSCFFKCEVEILCVHGRLTVSDSLQPHQLAHQGALSMRILQAKIPEWVAMPSSRGSSQPRIEPRSPTL